MAAKAMKEIVVKADASIISKVKPALEKLTKDTDSDAAFFSTQALNLCK